ncbi:LacI family DNA-binding transcriptional regulator [Novosphingobium umbonatum]|uniref:LacI family DNA-binding transcriptional regulator n=1 Tax=Novosphingobium umbonatum TaxID=1908524 RepID=A0A3S2Y9Q8_9SPHN|nr:LacI family DNA-binding transcriptional regulator [Novosphingobium umbonatum]RVU05648.1 LacI family DNA-binding transcriptional regulator [Novosphingobium umbonatum]
MTRTRSRSQRNAATIKDVAQHAGVSSMTVSRVINGDGMVRDTTRAKVTEAIKALNYSPSVAARQLAGGDELRIALAYANPSAAYLSELLMGCLEQTSRLNVQLTLERFEPDCAVADVVKHLKRGQVNGIILPTPLCDREDMLSALQDENIPTVTVAPASNRPDSHCVYIDDFEAAKEMTRYLIDTGHRRIGFIKGNPQHGSSVRRYRGFLAALAEAGMDMDPTLVEQGLYTYRSGLSAAEKLLRLPQRPTAIFASNDDMAAATIAMAHMMMLHVPFDLSVCGCDDTPLATTIWPELTTIRLPIREMAMSATEMLVEAVRSRKRKSKIQHQLFDCKLVRRQSDAPPPSYGRG